MSASDLALQDALDVANEVGTTIRLIGRTEGNLTRDAYGSIVKRDNVTTAKDLICFPIRFNPSEKDLRLAGISENVNVIFWLPQKELDNQSVDYADLDPIRARVLFQGVEYVIKQRGKASQYGSAFLHITLGCINT